jgi:hypothetical protein
MTLTNTVWAIDFYENGEIHQGDVHPYVDVYNDAIVNMTGGSVTGVFGAYDSSVINISGGNINILVGSESSSIYLTDSANINEMRIYGSSILNMNSGTTNIINIYSSDNADIYGGIINDYLSVMTPVDIYGYGFIYNQNYGNYGGGQLTGFWGSGLSFSIALVAYNHAGADPVDTWSQIRLHEIPEPATFVLFILGAAFLQRKNSANK